MAPNFNSIEHLTIFPFWWIFLMMVFKRGQICCKPFKIIREHFGFRYLFLILISEYSMKL